MIDVLHEKLISLAMVRDTVPICKGTLARLVCSGKLETVKFGGRRFSSREAIARAVVHGPEQLKASVLCATPTRARQQAEAALERLRLRLGGFG